MDETTVGLFVNLVKQAIDSEPNCQEIEPIEASTLEEVYKLSNMHSVLPMVSFSLFKQKILPKDADITLKFRDAQIKEVYHSERMGYDFQQICDLFERFEIDYIPLKGSVIRQYYPEPWMRTSCDIDILVKQQSVDMAVAALCDELKFTYVGKGFHDVSLKSVNGTHIELHFTLVEDNRMPKAAQVLSSVWDSAKLSKGFLHKYELDSEMFLVYHIVHMAKHFFSGGCGIRTFIDLKLINSNFKINDDKLKNRLKEIDLLCFYNNCLLLCDVWFGDGIHNSTTKALEQYVLQGGVYGSSKNYMAVLNNKGKSRFSFVFKVIFLPRKNLELIYPNLVKHPLLFPFYQVKRWFRVFNKKRRKRVTGIVLNSKTPQAETIESVDSLFSALGLKLNK